MSALVPVSIFGAVKKSPYSLIFCCLPFCQIIWTEVEGFVHYVPKIPYFDGLIEPEGPLKENIVQIYPLNITFGHYCTILASIYSPTNCFSFGPLEDIEVLGT